MGNMDCASPRFWTAGPRHEAPAMHDSVRSWIRSSAISKHLSGTQPNCGLASCPGTPSLWRRVWRKQGGASLQGVYYCQPECIEAALIEQLRHLERLTPKRHNGGHRGAPSENGLRSWVSRASRMSPRRWACSGATRSRPHSRLGSSHHLRRSHCRSWKHGRCCHCNMRLQLRRSIWPVAGEPIMPRCTPSSRSSDAARKRA